MIFNYNASPPKQLMPQIINEVYFGKTRGIQKIEAKMDSFRNRYMGRILLNASVNSDPELLKINRMFGKEFGFGTFTLHVIDSPSMNAYTMPIDYRIDVMTGYKDIVADPNGFKFRPETDYCCVTFIYSGLIFNEHFTTEEIMACILHEIGHNFYSCLNRKNGIMVNIYKVFVFIAMMQGDLSPILNMNMVKTAVAKFERDLIAQNSFLMDIKYTFDNIMNTIKALIGTGFYIVNLLTFNMFSLINLLKRVANVIMNPLSKIFLPMSYRNERSADNLPTMYGYGPATASLQRKFEEHGNNANKLVNNIETLPIVSTLYNAIPLPGLLLLTAFDEHPVGIARCKDQMDLLQRELNKTDLDPKMRKVIQADINAINKQIDKITNTSKGIKDPDLARHAYNRMLYKLTGDRAIKDILLDDRKKFEEYDRTYFDQLAKS